MPGRKSRKTKMAGTAASGPRPLYVGNRATNQFHVIRFDKGDCQIEEIKDRVDFTTFEEAIGNGFALCGHCAKRIDYGKRNPEPRTDDPGC